MSRARRLIGDCYYWLNQDPEPTNKKELASLISRVESGDDKSIKEMSDSFENRIKFGTAGLRAPMRSGPNGMNRVVVCQTTAGLAEYLLSRFSRDGLNVPQVVVGFDCRHNSETFANDVAEVLSGHGVQALLMPEMTPTPIVAFAVGSLEADAGVMITASHNPSTDNGYKVFLRWEQGASQIVSPADQDIEKRIQAVSREFEFSNLKRSKSNLKRIDANILSEYVRKTLVSLNIELLTARDLSVVYSPMHGVGGATFLRAMAEAGFSTPHVVEQQFRPNPDFPTVAFPNPEEEGALDLSFEKARLVSADLVIAHDPDADRLAVGLPNPAVFGEYGALTGNQVGAILGWHIAQRARAAERTGTLANSLVSSPVLGKIANHFGLDHEETLTGFKYVSRVKNLIFGFEEALGYLVTPDVVRDKDGISAGLLMLSIAHALAAEGKTLWDYLREIEQSVGAFASGQVTIRLDPGVSGSTVTSALRKRGLSALGAGSVSRHDDFLEGVADFPKEDILRYYLSDGTRVIARPSGTEPKAKIYIDTEGSTSQEAQSRLSEVESDIKELVSSL